MVTYVNLRKTGTGWEFENEDVLEDFVWANLTPLFGLIPLKRQYIVNEQRCDILALGENRQLVVLELKNVEDRYVVNQLTRYYDVLREEKPFSEQIDYDLPIGLIAIAPTFHKDNFRDRKYCHLDIEFLQFEILVDGEKFYLQLKDVESEKVSQLEVPSLKIDFALYEDLPEPPKLLLNWLASLPSEKVEEILKFRKKVLSFDKRMLEITDSKTIKYGIVKTKLCAELGFQRKDKNIVLFLWLQIPNYRKKAVGRMQVHTDWNFYGAFSHVPEGFCNPNKNTIYVNLRKYEDEKSVRVIREEDYVYISLNVLLDEALKTWQDRI